MNRLVCFFILFLFLFSFAPFAESKDLIAIPLPAFKVNQTRSDPDRPARAHEKYYSGPIIDVHTHLYPPSGSGKDWLSASDIDKGELKDILQVVKEQGVELIIFMPTPNDGLRRNQKLGPVKRQMIREMDPNRVRVFCGSNYITVWLDSAYNSGGYSEGEVQSVLRQLEEDINSGDCAGIGEIGPYHFDKGFGGQNVLEFPLNFDLFLRIVDLVARKGMWLDLHAEPVTPDGKSYEKEVFGGIELLYQRNPNLKLIYSHTAMTNPTNSRKILKQYPNIMMNIKAITKHNWWRNLEPVVNTDGELYEDWARLFEEMPERFMIGTDSHFGREGFRPFKYERKIERMRGILGTLEPRAARLIAYENAKRLFK